GRSDGPEKSEATGRNRGRQMAADVVRSHDAAAGAMREVGAHARLRVLAPPVLVLVGDRDSTDIHTVAGCLEAEAQFAASAVIPGTGHTLAMEQPAAFNAAVLTFLERARLTQ